MSGTTINDDLSVCWSGRGTVGCNIYTKILQRPSRRRWTFLIVRNVSFVILALWTNRKPGKQRNIGAIFGFLLLSMAESAKAGIFLWMRSLGLFLPYDQGYSSLHLLVFLLTCNATTFFILLPSDDDDKLCLDTSMTIIGVMFVRFQDDWNVFGRLVFSLRVDDAELCESCCSFARSVAWCANFCKVASLCTLQ